MAKKILYSDEWGKIVQYTRYRHPLTGRYLKNKTRVKHKKIEVKQYRYVGGKRFGSPIYSRRKGNLLKTTWPGLISDENGSIKEALSRTNIFHDVDKASYALINIRGMLPDGDIWRHQFKKNIGVGHESEQLVIAIYEELASFGYRMNYNINLVRFKHTSPRDAATRTPLIATELSVQLFS